MLHDLSVRDGSSEMPEKGISGRTNVPTRTLEGRWCRKFREGEDSAKIKREGQRGLFGLGVEKTRNGEGRVVGGGAKLLRSSRKNLEGGGRSVITSSMSRCNNRMRLCTFQNILRINLTEDHLNSK